VARASIAADVLTLSGVCVVAEIGDSGIGVNRGRPWRIHHRWTKALRGRSDPYRGK